MSMQQANAALMRALNFTPEDLAANRQGKLTPAQRERLKISVAQGMRIGYGVAAIVIVIVVAVCVFVVLGSQGVVPMPASFEGLGENAPLIVGVMGVILVFYVIMLLVSTARSRGMTSGSAKVRALTGKVKTSTLSLRGRNAAIASAGGASAVSYVIQIGREKVYTTDETAYRAFEDGLTYRVYVVGSKPGYMMVSAEAIR